MIRDLAPSHDDAPLKRICPLLERPSATRILPYAPPPWVLRQCRETGFVFLENPPDYASFREELAWEVTSEQDTRRKERAAPKLQAISALLKRIRGPRWCGFRWPAHVNYLTPRTLRLLAASANLEVSRMTVFDRHPFSDNLYAVLRRTLEPQPARTAAKPRVLVADAPGALATIRAAIVEELELVPAFTFDEALRNVSSVDMIISGLHFDDSRMFELLHAAKRGVHLCHKPFLCVRMLEPEGADREYTSLRAACAAHGAAGFLDLAVLQRSYGLAGAYRQFGRVVLAWLANPQRARHTAHGN